MNESRYRVIKWKDYEGKTVYEIKYITHEDDGSIRSVWRCHDADPLGFSLSELIKNIQKMMDAALRAKTRTESVVNYDKIPENE
jgi:hypothetical protein